MEGDIPIGVMVIPKYVELRAQLQERTRKLHVHPRSPSPDASRDDCQAARLLEQSHGLQNAGLSHNPESSTQLKFLEEFFGRTSITLGITSSWPSSSAIYDSYSDDKGEGEDSGDDSQLKDYYRGSLQMRGPEYNLAKSYKALCWWLVSQVSIFH